jgi:predicted O-methyltransferase YrrM
MSSQNFMLRAIDLCGLVVVDAGTGAANTTLWLAKELKEAGGGKIISIDRNLEVFSDAESKLGELARLVEFV